MLLQVPAGGVDLVDEELELLLGGDVGEQRLELRGTGRDGREIGLVEGAGGVPGGHVVDPLAAHLLRDAVAAQAPAELREGVARVVGASPPVMSDKKYERLQAGSSQRGARRGMEPEASSTANWPVGSAVTALRTSVWPMPFFCQRSRSMSPVRKDVGTRWKALEAPARFMEPKYSVR